MSNSDSNNESDREGRLAANIMYFGRVLRAAGLPIGPGRILAALQAVRAVGVARREDFYWALHAVLVNRRDQRELFDQAFHVFWRSPRIMERLMALILPSLQIDKPSADSGLSRRISDAMAEEGRSRMADRPEPESEDRIELDAAMTWSGREILQGKDFEKMTADEEHEARKRIQAMRLPIMDVATRRYRADRAGARADLRASLRAALRTGGDIIPLRYRSRRRRHPPLVILCDISGSMDRYSRMFIHFMHAITNDRDRVHTFLFGTRLTNITRYLRHRDVDVALGHVAGAVEDWAGGTRIGQCLHDFNRQWSRRVLGQGALVLFISDGLDREGGAGLAGEMERLHKSCRRLIWLNPLLRYDGFEPKSLGVRAIMPHVDEFRPVHNLDSLEALTAVLGQTAPRNMNAMRKWRELAA